uniref:Uncharacterized protein n=1 Tax=Globodera rostochiensis TaxID=31243 RepID=A0A914HJD6_GLORO
MALNFEQKCTRRDLTAILVRPAEDAGFAKFKPSRHHFLAVQLMGKRSDQRAARPRSLTGSTGGWFLCCQSIAEMPEPPQTLEMLET